MNYRSLVLLCALGFTPGVDLLAETEVAVTGEDAARREQAPLTPAQLDELLSPIALYPDPLIALILPASTYPADVVMAARYLKAGGDPQAVESQDWDDSVKALARYPEVVKWMDENLAWTRQLGEVFTLQPADILTSTQRLRTTARAAGNLADTPQQKVVVEKEVIRIVPAQPEVIYVPIYDPIYIYRPYVVGHYHPRPILRFGTGYRTGFWLSYHCDWNYGTVLVINRPYRFEFWQSAPRWSCPGPSPLPTHHVWHQTRVVSRSQAAPPRQQVLQPASNLIATTNGEKPRPGVLRPPSGQKSPPPANDSPIAARPSPEAAAAPVASASSRPVRVPDRRIQPSPETGSTSPRVASTSDQIDRNERRQQTARGIAGASAPTAAPVAPASPTTPRGALSSPAPGRIESSPPNLAPRVESGLGSRPTARPYPTRPASSASVSGGEATAAASPAPSAPSPRRAAGFGNSSVPPTERPVMRSTPAVRPAPATGTDTSAANPNTTLAETETTSRRSRR